MINKFKNLLKKAVKMTDDIVVNMDGGVGGSWEVKNSDIECAIDEQIVECDDMNDCMPPWGHSDLEYLAKNPSPYTGIPAPAYLEDDPWFGPAPERTEKQKDYMAVEMEWKIEEEKKRKESGAEPDDIHQKMYEIATKNWNTVSESQGGSENFQEGPGGWNSGNGWGLYK